MKYTKLIWILMFTIHVTDGVQYEYFSKFKTWLDASSHCKSLGLQLPVLHTVKEYRKFFSVLPLANADDKDIWVGLTRNDSTGQYVWLDGQPLESIRWKQEEPKPYSGDRCAFVKTSEKEWFASECSEKRKIVCRNQVTGKYSLQDTEAEFHHASQICIQDGGHLPVLENSLEADRLKADVSSGDVWIGLLETTDGEFQWINEAFIPLYTWDYKDGNDGKYVHGHRFQTVGEKTIEIHAPGKDNTKPRPYMCHNSTFLDNYYQPIDHHYRLVADDAVMYFPPKMEFRFSKKTYCAMMCSRDDECFQYTITGDVCKTYGKSFHWKSATLGVKLYRPIRLHF